MSFPLIEKDFYKEKRFIVVAGGKVLFNGKTHKEVKEYFASPNTCLNHQNDIVPNIHTECWKKFKEFEYKSVKILSSKPKYFISGPATFAKFQFGHVWQNYYYKMFHILFDIKDKNVDDPMLILLGSHIDEAFTPQDPYYKSFTEKVVSDFGIKDYVFNDTPTIYEINNFWANNGDYHYNFKRMNEYLFDSTVVPWRKVYLTKSRFFGKWKAHEYLNAPNPVEISEVDERLFVDKGHNNIYEALVEQNVLLKRIYNENELEEFLESYGFESIEPGFHFHKEECIEYIAQHNQAFRKLQCGGGCSIEENIRYFNEVKTLVSISASGLQNILFMNPNSSNVLELETKFFQVSGIDVNEKLTEAGQELYDTTGEMDPETFSEACNRILRVSGEYHPWHHDLAHRLGINYKKIPNVDLDARTIIDKLKRDPEILSK